METKIDDNSNITGVHRALDVRGEETEIKTETGNATKRERRVPSAVALGIFDMEPIDSNVGCSQQPSPVD